MGVNMAGYKKYLYQVFCIYNGSGKKKALPIKFWQLLIDPPLHRHRLQTVGDALYLEIQPGRQLLFRYGPSCWLKTGRGTASAGSAK